MADSDEPINPFQFMMDDIMKAIGSANIDPQGLRRQFMGLALGADVANELPAMSERTRVESLFDLATRHLEAVGFLSNLPWSRRRLVVERPVDIAERCLEGLKSYLDLLASALSGSVSSGSQPGSMDLSLGSETDFASLAASLSASLGPMFSNAQVGSLVGHYALSALGSQDLLLPLTPPGDLGVVVGNLQRVSAAINVPLDEVALYWSMRELIVSRIMAQPIILDRFDTQLRLYLLDLKADTTRMMESFAEGAMSDPNFLTNFDPTAMLQQSTSPAQVANVAELQTTMAVVQAFVELVMATIGPSVFGSTSWIDAMNQYLDEDPAHSVMASVFGITLAEVRARAERFARELVGAPDDVDALVAGLHDASLFPSPDELDDVNLWRLRRSVDS
ncbi:zinc-dependent metalloprotease [Ferrimicrobium sp.]|uniref:zinc-dependent metalloprotease n=1 Tax=Ferrimicrobium sp. TaxID=2926050 RepID=UPI00261EBF6C|nr:zinc-dependent metalloprotease [Ferrimicrobium sp.]